MRPIKILTCVCACVQGEHITRGGGGGGGGGRDRIQNVEKICGGDSEVGCSWGGTRLVTCDLHTIEPCTPRSLALCEEHLRTLGMGWKAAVEADAIREHS